MNRFLALCSSVAVAGAVVAATASPAGAALPKVDVTNHSVTCNDIIGKIKFTVPLTLGGTTPNQVTVIAKSFDCVDNTVGVYDAAANPGGVSLKGYSGKGFIDTDTNDCLGLQGLSDGSSGTINGKFLKNAGTPTLINQPNALGLTAGNSTLVINQTYGGVFNDGGVTMPAENSNSWGAQYGMFQIGADANHGGTAAPGVQGAYSGGSGGVNSTLDATTAQSSGSLSNMCFTKGIKTIQFGIGGFTLG
jgi:hypothetical protein